MSLKAVRKWEPAVPQGPKPDNLTVFKGPPPKPFVPTYERAGLRPDIKMLVSMDYRRQWFQECGKFHKFTYPQADRGVLQRKHVAKDAWKKTPACINAPPPPLRKAKRCEGYGCGGLTRVTGAQAHSFICISCWSRWAGVAAKVDSGLGDLASQLGQLVPQCGTCREFHASKVHIINTVSIECRFGRNNKRITFFSLFSCRKMSSYKIV